MSSSIQRSIILSKSFPFFPFCVFAQCFRAEPQWKDNNKKMKFPTKIDCTLEDCHLTAEGLHSVFISGFVSFWVGDI